MKIVLASLLLLASSLLHAQTSMWRVSYQGNEVYLGGTVHVLSASDLPFPEPFEQAYERADLLVLETDMNALNDPQLQVRLMSELAYKDGTLLTQVISPALYNELNQYLANRGLMQHMFIGMKPAGVMITMLAVELERLGIGQDGADFVYFERAKQEGKPTRGLESFEEHIGFIINMGAGNEERFLRQSLIDARNTETMMADMIRFWKTGDTEGLERSVIRDMQENYPNLYRTLLVERNERWLPQIEAFFSTPDVELVLVGAAHLVGDDGILHELERKGYSIEQL